MSLAYTGFPIWDIFNPAFIVLYSIKNELDCTNAVTIASMIGYLDTQLPQIRALAWKYNSLSHLDSVCVAQALTLHQMNWMHKKRERTMPLIHTSVSGWAQGSGLLEQARLSQWMSALFRQIGDDTEHNAPTSSDNRAWVMAHKFRSPGAGAVKTLQCTNG